MKLFVFDYDDNGSAVLFEKYWIPQKFVNKMKELKITYSNNKETFIYTHDSEKLGLCSMILAKNINKSQPYFTSTGSFWTNNVKQLFKRNKSISKLKLCFEHFSSDNYQSVAIIPLYSKALPFGLLYFNDKQTNIFTREKILFIEQLVGNLSIWLERWQAIQSSKIQKKDSAGSKGK